MIGMVVGVKNGANYIKAGEIAIAINSSTGETVANINADHIFLNGQTSVEALLTGEATVSEMGVTVQTCTTGRPARSISLTIVAPQRVQVPQVLVRIMALTPSSCR